MEDMKSNLRLSADDMWNLMSGDGNNNFGVVGYEAPKIYLDHRKIIKDREIFDLNLKVWSRKEKHYPKPKVAVDKDGNPIIPKKINFIDEIIKRSQGNFSKEKYDKYIEFLQSKGKTLEEIEGAKVVKEKDDKKPEKSKIYTHDRITYLAEIQKNEQKKLNISPEFQTVIDGVKEKQGKYKSKYKDETERILDEYKGKTSLVKSDRVTFFSDTEFLSERIPFYNSNKIDGEDAGGASDSENKKDKKKNHLFFPEKLATMKTSPKWTINKESKINREFIERKEELLKEKAENVKKSWEDRRIKFIDDVSISYFNSHPNKSKGTLKLTKPLEKQEQYALAKERSPLRHPGPQHYFKTPIVKITQGSPKKSEIPKEEGEGENKIYYLNREKTDKRLYKPMKSYVF